MGLSVGTAIALGGLGQGIERGTQAYDQAKTDEEKRKHQEFMEKLQMDRLDEMNRRLVSQGDWQNLEAQNQFGGKGGVIGDLPEGYDQSGRYHAPGTIGAAMGAAASGQSTATTQQPFSSETSSTRDYAHPDMKRAGTFQGKPTWLPADGLTTKDRTSLGDKETAVAQDRADGDTLAAAYEADPKVKLTPAERTGLINARTRASTQRIIERRLGWLDPMNPGSIAGKEAVKAAPGGGRDQTDKAQTQRRILLHQNEVASMGQLTNAQKQQTAVNKDLASARGRVRNMQGDTTASNPEAAPALGAIKSLQADSAQIAGQRKTYGRRAQAYTDSLAMPDMGMGAAAGNPAAVLNPQAEQEEYAKAAHDYQAAIANGHAPQDIQAAYQLRVQKIALKYHPNTSSPTH